MDCTSVQEWISSFVDGELDEQRTGRMFEHLGSCRDCQEFLRSLLDIRNAFAAERTKGVPDSVETSIGEALRGKRTMGASIGSLRIIMPVPVAIAAALLLVIGSLTFMPLVLEGSSGIPPQSEFMDAPPFPPEAMQRVFSVLR